MQRRSHRFIMATSSSSVVTFICYDRHSNVKYVILSTFRKGGAKSTFKSGANHYNNNLEKMFNKYNYKYTKYL